MEGNFSRFALFLRAGVTPGASLPAPVEADGTRLTIRRLVPANAGRQRKIRCAK